jgi:hypothetical protein
MLRTLIKTTQDGRKLEVIGFAIYLEGQLEAIDVIEIKLHPNGRKIWETAPEATHVAGRVTLTREEAEAVEKALKESQEAMLNDPASIAERFRVAAMMRAREQGIE